MMLETGYTRPIAAGDERGANAEEFVLPVLGWVCEPK